VLTAWFKKGTIDLMKQRLFNIAKVALFALMALSVALPRVASLSFCNPMDQVMLQSCCHPSTVQIEEDQVSVSRPNCCDDISVPDAEQDISTEIAFPSALAVSAWFAIPTPRWVQLYDVPSYRVVRVRGPPPDPIPLFIQHCSYRI
jgi:hypothetical protein